jgi:hypothetical protein
MEDHLTHADILGLFTGGGILAPFVNVLLPLMVVEEEQLGSAAVVFSFPFVVNDDSKRAGPESVDVYINTQKKERVFLSSQNNP